MTEHFRKEYICPYITEAEMSSDCTGCHECDVTEIQADRSDKKRNRVCWSDPNNPPPGYEFRHNEEQQIVGFFKIESRPSCGIMDVAQNKIS